MKHLKTKKAFTTIELLVAITVFALATVGIFYVSLDNLQSDSKTILDSQALNYAQEGIEAVRQIRDRNYLSLVTGIHGLSNNGGVWGFTPPPETVNSTYQRKITITDIYRDSSGNITTNGGVMDINTKAVTSEVLWYERGTDPRRVVLTTFMSDWRGDDWVNTTCTEFATGTFNNMETQVVAAPPSDNCDLKLEDVITQGEELAFVTMTGNAHSNDVAAGDGYAYTLRRKSPELKVIDVSDPSDPHEVGSLALNGGGSKETYVTKSGNYLYCGVGNKNGGLVVVNVSNPSSPVIAKTVDIGDSGLRPTVSGNYLYMPVADKGTASLKIYNITDRANPIYVSTVTTVAQVKSLEVSGNYAYIGMNNSSGWGNPVNSFAIYNVSNPSSAVKVSELDVGDWINTISVSGPMAYLAIPGHSGQKTIIAVNINNINSPVIQSNIDITDTIQDIDIYGNRLYAAIDRTNQGLAAIDIDNPYNPSVLYKMDIGGKATGIDTDEHHIYIAIDTSNKGLAVLEREQTGVATSGDFISINYDTGSADTKYNYIEWEGSLAPSGSVRVQIRTADTIPHLSTAVWVGSDGTASSYYANSRTPILLAPNRSGSRYYQYKVYFNSDGSSSPILSSIKLNYTP